MRHLQVLQAFLVPVVSVVAVREARHTGIFDDVAGGSSSSFEINPPSSGAYAPFGISLLARPLRWLASFGLGWPSYSQYHQDQKLMSILGQIKQGFFVESGAFDGETGSNTLLYEMQGWSGLLVEPSPDAFKSLVSKNRKASSFNGALSATGGIDTIDFHNVAGSQSNFGSFLEIPSMKVPAVPLATLLHRLDQKTIDFWSLDIEGAEGRVLEHTDFEAIEVGVILIEMNKNGENNNSIRRVLLDREGFHEIGVMNSGSTGLPLDRVFINPKYFQKRGLAVPAHIGD